MRCLQRVAVSIPLADSTVNPETFVPIFHDWIRRGAVEGMLIDVARYGHVHQGPGVMLIGHEGDYSIDLADGRPELRYTLKRDNDGTPAELVTRALGRLLGAADALGQADVAVGRGELTVRVFDRLRAPNTPDTAEALTGEITTGIQDVLGVVQGEVAVVSDDSREPFALRFGSAIGLA